jgi:hypothetical protein
MSALTPEFIKRYDIVTTTKATYRDIAPHLRTGDIVLFYGSGFISEAIRVLTGGECTHVGVVVRDHPGLPQGAACLAEAYLGHDGEIDVISGEPGTNIRIVNLEEKLKTYNAKRITVRQLLCIREDNEHTVTHGERRRALEQRIVDVALAARGKLIYDSAPSDFLRALEKNTLGVLNKRVSNENNRRYCSAFVAFVYRSVGVFNPKSQWSDEDFFPRHFSSESFSAFDLPFERHYVFSPFEPHIQMKQGEIYFD